MLKRDLVAQKPHVSVIALEAMDQNKQMHTDLALLGKLLDAACLGRVLLLNLLFRYLGASAYHLNKFRVCGSYIALFKNDWLHIGQLFRQVQRHHFERVLAKLLRLLEKGSCSTEF